ncbi:MAG: hypothetical protein GYB25_14965 [Rhodobacteraceae bacterium]|nr:hypothetical protein [Paracoccaceae bacterium]
MLRPLSLIAALSLAAAPLAADEITDTLQSAIEAYEEGDVAYALEELEYAKQQMLALKTDALSGYLPEAPAGWTRELNSDMNAGLAMMGGGVGAEAEYSGDGQSFTIMIMADNPMVGAMAGMIGNAGLMGAKITRVGRQKFMDQDGQMSALIDHRILVQAEGASQDIMIPVLETIDYKALGRFGQ